MTLQCDIDEDLIFSTASLMQTLGLQDIGYNNIHIDDCYAEKERDDNGKIVADAVRFKSGMRNLTDRVHALGL